MAVASWWDREGDRLHLWVEGAARVISSSYSEQVDFVCDWEGYLVGVTLHGVSALTHEEASLRLEPFPVPFRSALWFWLQTQGKQVS